jgi:archaellum component FlaC
MAVEPAHREKTVEMEARIARVESDVAHLRVEAADIKADVRELRGLMDHRMDRLESKLDKVESRFDRVDSKFDGVESKFNRVDSKFDGLKDDISSSRRLGPHAVHRPCGQHLWHDGARVRLDLVRTASCALFPPRYSMGVSGRRGR